MKRLMGWQPDPSDASTRFEVEWDTDDVEAPHVCLRAWVDGEASQDPQGAYEAALAANRAQNTKRRRK